jgi:hypothetical protein
VLPLVLVGLVARTALMGIRHVGSGTPAATVHRGR